MKILISCLAGLFELGALYLFIKKNVLGFYSGIICNILWIFYTIYYWTNPGLFVVVSFAFVLNIKGINEWSKLNKENE